MNVIRFIGVFCVRLAAFVTCSFLGLTLVANFLLTGEYEIPERLEGLEDWAAEVLGI